MKLFVSILACLMLGILHPAAAGGGEGGSPMKTLAVSVVLGIALAGCAAGLPPDRLQSIRTAAFKCGSETGAEVESVDRFGSIIRKDRRPEATPPFHACMYRETGMKYQTGGGY